MLCDGERREREFEQAMDDYMRDVREYRDRIIEYLDAWVAYDYRLHARVEDTREPVLVPPPVHPEDMEEWIEAHKPSDEIPF